MNAIELRFVTSNDWVSWAIRRFGNGLFNAYPVVAHRD